MKDRLVQHGCTVIEHAFIQTKNLPVRINIVQEYLIFTSQNAVNIAFSNTRIRPFLKDKKYFCVG